MSAAATIRVQVGKLSVDGHTLIEGYDKTTVLDRPRIGLVGCGSLKAIGPCAAKDLYGSTLFRLARAYVEATCDRWYILSAKFGLLEPERRVAPYEVRLNRGRNAEAWGRRVAEAVNLAVPYAANATIVCLAGGIYAEALSRALVSDLRWEEPLVGKPIGLRLQWLKENTPR